ncbi:G-protein alpha subunit-domain-containing protein [Xylariaceae sp. FL0255]|nr:G-protein alpha subunit-domain-containing protein [Xylariaceae sp. FL0255]
MDPGDLFQIVATAVSIGEVVIKCIKCLRTLKSKYHDAPLIVSTLIGQLYMVQSALDQLSVWNNEEHGSDPRYQQLAEQIGNALDSFNPLVTTLASWLDDDIPADGGDMTLTQRFRSFWNEKDTSDFSILLDRQVNALNLLLQAVQCNSLAQQQSLLCKEESQSILHKAKECSDSMIALGDSESLISEDTNGISLMFDFDGLILASRIYQQAERSHLRQAIRAGKLRSSNQLFSPENLEDSVQAPSRQLQTILRYDSPQNLRVQTDPLDIDVACEETPTTPEVEKIREQLGSQMTLREASSTIISRRIGYLARRARVFGTGATRSQILRILKLAPMANAPKFLVLGTPKSGKTTLIESLRILLGESRTEKERLLCYGGIWSDVIDGFQEILKSVEFFNIPYENDETKSYAENFRKIGSNGSYPRIANAILSLWHDRWFQGAYKSINKIDNTAYYASKIKTMAFHRYVPTDEDILRASRKMERAPETYLSGSILRGGLENIFIDSEESASQEPVTPLVLFTVDVTAFCFQRLWENGRSVNRMKVQLTEFSRLVNSRMTSRCGLILIFTKLDLIEEGDLDNYSVKQLSKLLELDPDIYLHSVEVYIKHLEAKFLDSIQSKELRDRVRVIREKDFLNTASRVVDAINALAIIYPELFRPAENNTSTSSQQPPIQIPDSKDESREATEVEE